MNLELSNKTIFIAGASRGIGQGIARTMLKEGARVVITGRNADDVGEARTAFEAEFGADRVLGFAGDLAQAEQLESAINQTHERWGAIDCLVCNIGSGTAKNGWDLSAEDWNSVFQVNFWTSIQVAQAVLPAMVEARTGSIIFIGSIAGLESIGAPLTYGASKAALAFYTKDLARQVGKYGVRVNMVAPGNILFAGGSWQRKIDQNPETVQQMLETQVPLVRFGTPEEIGSVVAFLASARAAFITGACIVADGGQTRS